MLPFTYEEVLNQSKENKAKGKRKLYCATEQDIEIYVMKQKNAYIEEESMSNYLFRRPLTDDEKINRLNVMMHKEVILSRCRDILHGNYEYNTMIDIVEEGLNEGISLEDSLFESSTADSLYCMLEILRRGEI